MASRLALQSGQERKLYAEREERRYPDFTSSAHSQDLRRKDENEK
jgi:hypothetical protein